MQRRSRSPRPLIPLIRSTTSGSSSAINGYKPLFSGPNTVRSFGISSPHYQSNGDEDDSANPWRELDDSVRDWEAGSPRSNLPLGAQKSNSSQLMNGVTADLSAEEAMWLHAVNARLDMSEATKCQSNPVDTVSYHTRPPVSTHAPHFQAAPSQIPAAEARRLTHLTQDATQPRMVSVAGKSQSARSATAEGKVFLPFSALPLLVGSGRAAGSEIDSPAGKGPVFATARIGGIMAAKKTHDLIPLCHSIALDGCDIDFELVSDTDIEDPSDRPHILITATTTTRAATGVEMEALVAVTSAATTVWDMLKSCAGKEMEIGEIKVVSKTGGKSGDWVRHD